MTTLYDESLKVTSAPDKVTATRVLRVEPYADFPLVLARLLGQVVLAPSGALVRTPPARLPSLPWCFCRRADVDGVGVFGSNTSGPIDQVLADTNGYENGARITATYETPDATQGQQDQAQGDNATPQQEADLASESFEFSAQALTLPNDRYKWSGSTALLSQTLAAGTGATKTIPRIEYALQRHYVLALPFQAITKLLGKINNATFTVNGNAWPADTLRFDGVSATRKVNFQGLQYYDVTCKWAGMPVFDLTEGGTDAYVGWNRLYRPDAARWEKPVLVSDGTTEIHRRDNAIVQTRAGVTRTGFDLLFWPLSV